MVKKNNNKGVKNKKAGPKQESIKKKKNGVKHKKTSRFNFLQINFYFRKNFDINSTNFIDEQPISRKVREIIQMKELVEQATASTKPKKRAKNRFFGKLCLK